MKLTGRATVPGGRPAIAAVVELHNSSGDIVTQVRVDDDGAFTFHLVEGDWHLNAWDAEGHRGHMSLHLTDDDEDVALELQ